MRFRFVQILVLLGVMAGAYAGVARALDFDDEDPDRNPGVLRRLARATGGEAFFPEKVSDVMAICTRIARDIRHQYTIGYVPTNPTRNGGYRAVRVIARAPGHGKLLVRTRAGYIAQPSTAKPE